MKFIHHKDGDLTNNDPSNLELRTLPYPRDIEPRKRWGEMNEAEKIAAWEAVYGKPEIDWLAINREASGN